MEEETSPSQAPADPAALAFKALREEVALVRHAVSGLAAERAAIEIPNYSQTLGQIVRASEATAAGLKALAATPALRLTAQDWGQEIAVASEQARRADQQALTQARDTLQQAARDMTAKLTSAKSADKQRQWLLGTWTGGFLGGMLLLAIGIGPVVRAMPESWHWPESMAANIVGMGQEAAGARLIESAAPNRWGDLVLGSRIVRDNRADLVRCEKAAAKDARSVRCAIEIDNATSRRGGRSACSKFRIVEKLSRF
jgi:Family of unknown function (DUF6118)